MRPESRTRRRPEHAAEGDAAAETPRGSLRPESLRNHRRAGLGPRSPGLRVRPDHSRRRAVSALGSGALSRLHTAPRSPERSSTTWLRGLLLWHVVLLRL